MRWSRAGTRSVNARPSRCSAATAAFTSVMDGRRPRCMESAAPTPRSASIRATCSAHSSSTQRPIAAAVRFAVTASRAAMIRRKMQRILVAALVLLLPSSALATWSVIAVDRSTGRVVIASATCVDRDDQFLMGVQAVVVPGKGVAACQAGVDGTHQNQMLVFQRAAEGHRSEADHRAAERGPGVPEPAVRHPRSAGPQRRPLRARPTATSRRTCRARCPAPRSSIRSRATSCGPDWSCRTRCRRSCRRQGAITDRVMAAMEAADGSGGDSRCTCPPWPADGSRAGDSVRRPDRRTSPTS